MHIADLGDHIGMESCVDLETDTEPPALSGLTVNRKPWGTTNRRSVSLRKCKQLPPPLPVQSSTVMNRYYTDDGRLVITEEKIQSPKFHFSARRSHGRLTIQLVNSTDSICHDSVKKNKCNLSLCDNQYEEDDNKEVAKVDYQCGDDSDEVAVIGGGGGGVVGTCYKYNAAVRVAATGPCLFVNQNQLHAIRPVQI